MAFGKKYEYNPVPERLGMLLVSYPEAGKTTLASQMRNKGKFGVVVDADQRFDEVVEDGMNFVQLSDSISDMVNPKRVFDIAHESMPNSDVGLFVVDSVTAILEPIILQIQRDIEEGNSKGARGYKAKADAMKYLQAALTPWDADVIWIYHYRDRGTVKGSMEKTTTISELELARLYRNINIKCEVVVDKNGKRGLKVLEARRGRSGITIWDDSGKWENIRERLEDAVWGGLTKAEQDTMEQSVDRFKSKESLIAWAMEQEGVFKDEKHAQNSYDKLRNELDEELGSDLTAEIMFEAFAQKVLKKLEESK